MADLEALRTAMDAFGRVDVDELMNHITPDVEGIVPPSVSAEPDSYIGPEGIRRYFDLFMETVDDLHFETEVLEEHGDAVVASLRVLGQGRVSGVPIDSMLYTMVVMRGDKIARIEGHATADDAREAALRR